MRIALLTLAALIMLAGTSSANEKKDLIIKTDRFTGESSVILKSFSIASGVDPDGKLVQLGMGAGYFSKDDLIMLSITCYAGSYKMLNGVDVFALVDGERVNLGHFAPGDASVTTTGGVMTNEIIAGYTDRSVLAKLAGAKTMELKVGTWELKLKDKHIEKLREFSSAVPAQRTASK